MRNAIEHVARSGTTSGGRELFWAGFAVRFVFMFKNSSGEEPRRRRPARVYPGEGIFNGRPLLGDQGGPGTNV